MDLDNTLTVLTKEQLLSPLTKDDFDVSSSFSSPGPEAYHTPMVLRSQIRRFSEEQEEIEALRQALEEEKESNEKLAEEIGELTRKMTECKPGDLKTYKMKYEEKSFENQKLTMRNDVLNGKVADLQSELSKIQETNKSLKSKLQEQEGKNGDLMQDVANLKEEINRLENKHKKPVSRVPSFGRPTRASLQRETFIKARLTKK